MASGIITGTTGNEFIDSRIEWNSTPDTTGNYSVVTASLYYKRNNSYSGATYGTGSFTLTINGEETTQSGVYLEIYNTAWVLALNATAIVYHNDDGSKTITISASGGMPGISFNSTNCTGSAVLDQIARASVISSADDAVLGGNCRVKWKPASASFGYRLKFSLGDWSETTGPIHPNRTYDYIYDGYTIPLIAAYQIAGTVGVMSVTLYTYSDSAASVQVGGTSASSFAVTVPDNSSTRPTLRYSYAAVNDLPYPFSTMYIHGKSRVRFSITATVTLGSQIVNRYIRHNGVVYDADNAFTTGILEYSSNEKQVIYVCAENSRGFVAEERIEISVMPYSKPQLVDVVCERCDGNGTFSGSGTCLRIIATRNFTSLSGENQCAIRFRYRASGDSDYSTWETLLSSGSAGTNGANTVDTGAILNGALALNTSYVVQVGVVDSLGEESNLAIGVPTEEVDWHRGKHAWGLGKRVEREKLLDVAWDTQLRGDVLIGDEGVALREYILGVVNGTIQ